MLLVGPAAMSALPVIGSSNATRTRNTRLAPAVLKPGDTVGLITPAGALNEEDAILTTREVFEKLGFRVKEGAHIRERYGNLAGKDEQRVADIHAMFLDGEIKAIVCIRGGNGASRLLDKLDYELIARHPKVLLGYSDVTALLMAFYAKSGLISFHGAVGTSTWSHTLADAFKRQFYQNELSHFENPPAVADNFIRYNDRIRTLHPGVAEGVLLGGNLTLLSGLCGSPYLPDFKGAILFLEEVDEDTARLDRMFCQLKNAGILADVKGIIFGNCTNCKPAHGYGSLTLDQLLEDYIKPLHVPAYTGARIGHINNQFILPIGVRVRMDADKGTIDLLEKALH
ncbi:S66 peptidase family protein [Sphingobacterium suaedae]|uniref:LD-carboxypeptidase n=1 Tax=Sphingobacterium suaedae TaxID=1686402 RepID=A0ABW5KJK7_9SPHI